MIRFLLALVFIGMASVAHAEVPGIEAWHQDTVKFDAHAEEVLFSDVKWMDAPNLCARNEKCIFALGKDLVIIKSNEPWLKIGYVIKHAFATKEQEEALFAQPCYLVYGVSSCSFNRLDDYYAQLFHRADYLFKKALHKR